MKTALQKKSLSKLARQINTAHAKAEGALRSGLQYAKEAGDLLLEAKGQVGHRQWLPWLRDNCTMPARTAQAYMRVSKLWPELEAKCASLAHLSFEGAVKFLAAPKPERPEPEPDPVLVPFESALADFRDFITSVNDEDLWKREFTNAFEGLHDRVCAEGMKAYAVILNYDGGEWPVPRAAIDSYVDKTTLATLPACIRDIRRLTIVCNGFAEMRIRTGCIIGTFLNAIEQEPLKKEFFDAFIKATDEEREEVRRMLDKRMAELADLEPTGQGLWSEPEASCRGPDAAQADCATK